MLGATCIYIYILIHISGWCSGFTVYGPQKVETENQAGTDMDNEMEAGMCRIYAD